MNQNVHCSFAQNAVGVEDAEAWLVLQIVRSAGQTKSMGLLHRSVVLRLMGISSDPHQH